PGTLALDLVAGDATGEIAGVIVLHRGTVARRVPFRGRVERARLSLHGARTLARTAIYAGNTRGHRSLVETYRYPEVPTGGPVAARLAGPEQVFRVRITRPVANFGVAIVQQGPGSRVEPRVVRGGDENRLTGYAALPLHQNTHVDEVGAPARVA